MNEGTISTDVPPSLGTAPATSDGTHEAFEVAFNFSPDALALTIAEPDHDVRFWRVNQAFCELSGYGEAELVGRTANALALWEDDGLRRSVAAQLNAGSTISDLEAVMRRKGGERIPTAFSARRVTIAGRTAFLSIRRDIRDRAHMLHQLRRNEQRWRFALEGDGGALWDWDLTSDTVYRSASLLSILGIPEAAHECRASEGLAQFNYDDRESIKASLRGLLKGSSDDARGECTLYGRDGVPLCVSYSARVMARGPTGRAERVIGTLRDITWRKRRDEEVRLQREVLAHHGRMLLLGEQAAITAHEISQPLTTIANYASLLSVELSAHASLQEIAGRIEQQALRAGNVAWRILEFARRGGHEHRPIDIPALLGDIVKWFAESEHGTVRFRTLLPQRLPEPCGDRVQIEQVLANLVCNGIQAMDHLPSAKEMEIHANHDHGANQIIINVSDRGRGVPTRIAMEIYQPFFTTRKRGIGLGLAICNSIIGAHGGRLWCSARPGGGTTFSFTLPCAPNPDGAPAQDPRHHATTSTATRFQP